MNLKVYSAKLKEVFDLDVILDDSKLLDSSNPFSNTLQIELSPEEDSKVEFFEVIPVKFLSISSKTEDHFMKSRVNFIQEFVQDISYVGQPFFSDQHDVVLNKDAWPPLENSKILGLWDGCEELVIHANVYEAISSEFPNLKYLGARSSENNEFMDFGVIDSDATAPPLLKDLSWSPPPFESPRCCSCYEDRKSFDSGIAYRTFEKRNALLSMGWIIPSELKNIWERHSEGALNFAPVFFKNSDLYDEYQSMIEKFTAC